jgi:hypothetical protein
MALGFQKNSGEDFLPSFRFNAISGLAVIAGSEKSPDGVSWEKTEKDVTFPTKFIFDFENIQVGWIAFQATGPSFHLVKLGERMPAKPDDLHKQGFKLRLYSKEFGLCDFANSSKTVGEVVDVLHDQYLRECKQHEGKVPVVEIKGTNKVQIKSKEGVKTYRQPVWAIVSWIARPEAMDEKKIEEAKAIVADPDDF